MPDVILGIDLGTTFSCAAYISENGTPTLIPIGSDRAMPSVVRIVDGQVEVGQMALNQWGIDTDNIVRWVKRSMGDPSYLFCDLPLFYLPDDWADELNFPIDAEVNRGRKFESIPPALANAFTAAELKIHPAAILYEIDKGRSYSLVHEFDAGGYCIRKDRVTEKWSVLKGWSAVAISAEILRELKRLAENHLGHEVTKAVITCPAYFNSNEVDATFQAGVRAGFDVQEIVKEPVAAGVFHAVGRVPAGQRMVVCDLGGGTFDATILKIDDRGGFTPLHTRGNRRLGGHDWTQSLKSWMADEYRDKFEEDLTLDVQTNQKLDEAAETVKKNLALVERYRAVLQGKASTGVIEITREQFQLLTAGHIRRVQEKLDEVMAEAVAASQELSLGDRISGWQDIDVVLLVGGSSRLLDFRAGVTETTGKQIVDSDEPDFAVAYGAAVFAAGKLRPSAQSATSDEVGGLFAGGIPQEGGVYFVKPKRTTPRRLGTRAFDHERGKLVSVEMIPQGAEIPTERRNNQFEASTGDYCDIPVVEFEDPDADSFECISSFRCVFGDDVVPGDQLEIHFRYDLSGRTSVEAHHLTTGRRLAVERHPYRENRDVSPSNGRLTVLFALDISGSMGSGDVSSGSNLALSKQALIIETRKLLASSQTSVGVVLFGSRAYVLCAPNQDADSIAERIKTVDSDGSTNLTEALTHCRSLLEALPNTGEKEVVLLTDGSPDSKESAIEAADGLKPAGISLKAIRIGTGVDVEFLRRLTPVVVEALEPRDIGPALSNLRKRR
ncbi:MAG: Hsp70 family protein [Planctomycetaceae bacterium]|nr:Hsp70 family protein [Planctomycetaceae bacterium]